MKDQKKKKTELQVKFFASNRTFLIPTIYFFNDHLFFKVCKLTNLTNFPKIGI